MHRQYVIGTLQTLLSRLRPYTSVCCTDVASHLVRDRTDRVPPPRNSHAMLLLVPGNEHPSDIVRVTGPGGDFIVGGLTARIIVHQVSSSARLQSAVGYGWGSLLKYGNHTQSTGYTRAEPTALPRRCCLRSNRARQTKTRRLSYEI